MYICTFFSFGTLDINDFQLLLVTTGYNQKVAAELSSIPLYTQFLFASL